MSPPKFDVQMRRPTNRGSAGVSRNAVRAAVKESRRPAAERDKKKRGEKSELMDLLIAFNWNDNFKARATKPRGVSEHG